MVDVAPAYLVGVGGAFGAVLRHWVYTRLKREGDPVPRATLTVNVLGSFVLGLVTFAGAGGDVALFVGTGACGAFTTFSSFGFETVDRWDSGQRRAATSNAVGTLVLSLAAVAVGWLVAGVLP
ncbi:fluoride efflux transporter CrcB [Haloarchaeobius amylolyticus]|uniref:fluoride efflux transporter CrcB n=1 Tax=Haloarchaeobius amylolyticus TaxID=1198296 RepID=UPI00226EE248|nr:fluoride efflux transporter CrcB [Haloarchaeobius amylolyticus]